MSRGVKFLGVVIPIVAVLAAIGTGVGFAMSMKNKKVDNVVVNRNGLLAEGTAIGTKFKLDKDPDYGNQVEIVPNSSISHFNYLDPTLDKAAENVAYSDLYRGSTIGFKFVMDSKQVLQDEEVVLDDIKFVQLNSGEYLPSFDLPDHEYGFYPDYMDIKCHLQVYRMADSSSMLGNSVADYMDFAVKSVNETTEELNSGYTSLKFKDVDGVLAVNGETINVEESDPFVLRVNAGIDDDLKRNNNNEPIPEHIVLQDTAVNNYKNLRKNKVDDCYDSYRTFFTSNGNTDTFSGFVGTIRSTIKDNVEKNIEYVKQLYDLTTMDLAFTDSKGGKNEMPMTSYRIILDRVTLGYFFGSTKGSDSRQQFKDNVEHYKAQLYPEFVPGFDVDKFNSDNGQPTV